VRASQNDRVVFELSASFTCEADGPSIVGAPPPDLRRLPQPASLPLYHELMASHDPPPLPAEWALREHGVDVRIVNAPWSPNGPSADQGIRMWIRANGELPADPQLHDAMLAYQSDESLADTLLVPFGVTWATPGVFCVSLDHAMWFHRRVDLNNWHFVEQRPLHLAHERGVASAFVCSDAGDLVASFKQEVLLRMPAARARAEG
jgi:acyl-CoA thioesterase-2